MINFQAYQNINQRSIIQEYGLRKTIPFKISSDLKRKSIMKTSEKLTQITVQHKNLLKPKTPLIKKQESQSQNKILFTKKQRNTFNLLFQSQENSSNIQKNHQNKKLAQQNKENVQQQLINYRNDLRKQQNYKISFERCSSVNNFNIKRNQPLIKLIKIKPLEEINRNEKLDLQKQIRSPSFLNRKSPINSLKMFCLQNQQQKICSKNKINQHKKPRLNQRGSHYQSNSKVQVLNYRLCINCQNYVNKNLISEHEDKCLGFRIILKMSNSQLIDFLNEKISLKLHQLKTIQQNIEQIEDQELNLQKNNSSKNSQKIHLMHLKRKIDQVLTDLDGVRLKALKKFHINSRLCTE